VSSRDDLAYLFHIQDCIERIESYVTDGREAFLANRMAQDPCCAIFILSANPRNASRKPSNPGTPK